MSSPPAAAAAMVADGERSDDVPSRHLILSLEQRARRPRGRRLIFHRARHCGGKACFVTLLCRNVTCVGVFGTHAKRRANVLKK